MATNPGGKKPFGKQKTYGKAVKSHLNGWFGRTLWNELENSPGSNSKRNEPVQDDDMATKEFVATKKENALILPSKKGSKIVTDMVIAVKEEKQEKEAIVAAKGPSPDELDSMVSQLDGMGIMEDACPASLPPSEPIVTVERRTSVVIAQDLHSQSSIGSLQESSDKENEFAISTAVVATTTTIVLCTSQKSDEPEEDASYPVITPRNVLGECESLSVRESPPRKRGIRKRVSTSTAGVPSPLRSESITSENLSRDMAEDSIKVWEDEIDEAANIPERKVAVAIETNGRNKSTTPKASTSKTVTPKSSTSKDEISETPEQNYDAQEIIVVNAEELPPRNKLTPKTEVLETPAEGANDDSIIVRRLERLEASATTIDNTDSPVDDEALDELYRDEATEADVLLGLCTQQTVLGFDEYIDSLLENSSLRKLGEASYSEVFLQSRTDSDSTTVLKIIPFGEKDQCEIRNIIQEVRISKTMGQIEGYIGFRGAYVVQGCFPEHLMDAWDNFDNERESENVRPDFYEYNQLFAIILLENGGSDLEHTELQSWKEALDVFWQTVNALARGEEKHQFEHRDLHWGNLVIARKEEHSKKPTSDNPEALLEELSLEDGSSTLKVSLIDYTLSRAQCGDDETDVEFMPLDDPALFTGKGDYQFDIYRFMRKELSFGKAPPNEEWIDWSVHAPRTNIFWLHYLTNILLTCMGIRRPAARGRNAASQTEQDCFRQLEMVARAIDPRKKRLGKSLVIQSTRDLVEWAKAEKYI